MTFSYFPEYIEGETAYSWVAQYIAQSAVGYRNILSRNLFSNTHVRLHPLLPGHVSQLAKASDSESIHMLHHGTGFPLFAFFLSDPLKKQALEKAMLGDGKHIMSYSGQAQSKLTVNTYLKYCSECSIEDEGKYGTAYWHTVHQLYGVTVCPRHKQKLYCVNAGSGGTDRSFILPNPGILEVLAPPSDREIYLSDYISKLYNHLCQRTPAINLSDQYKVLLNQHGYLTEGGNIRLSNLLSDLSHFWIDLFNTPNPSVPIELSDYRYISRLAHSNRNFHYLKHIILMAFLSRNPNEFFEACPSTVNNFTNRSLTTSWDKNQRALLLLRRKISMRKIADQTGYSMGFIKQLALRNDLKIGIRSKFITPEIERSVWRQSFIGLHREKIALNHKISVSAVESIIQSHADLSAWRRHLKMAKKKLIHRATLLNYFQLYPEATRNQIKNLCSTTYSWLYKNDHDWLYAMLPDSENLTHHPCVNWQKRDQFLAIQLECISTNAKSISELDRELGDHGWLIKYKDHFPRSLAMAKKILQSESNDETPQGE